MLSRAKILRINWTELNWGTGGVVVMGTHGLQVTLRSSQARAKDKEVSFYGVGHKTEGDWQHILERTGAVESPLHKFQYIDDTAENMDISREISNCPKWGGCIIVGMRDQLQGWSSWKGAETRPFLNTCTWERYELASGVRG